MMKRALLAMSVAVGLGWAAGAHAALVTYVGADDSVSSLAQMTNSVAASNAFDAAVPGATLVDFESGVPAGLTISAGGVTNFSSGSVYGFNTTSGGAYYLSLFGGSTTFSFTNAIDSFGFYITGLQTEVVINQNLTFSDGSTQTIFTPSSQNGGGAFIGFTDFGKSITSVTYTAQGGCCGDIVGIDDVRFNAAAGGGAPEPATWAMMLIGFGGLGAMARKARRVLAA